MSATHCRHGHAWTPENTKIGSNGYRRCRECARAYDRAWQARRWASDPEWRARHIAYAREWDRVHRPAKHARTVFESR